jgi:hypothetical protein
MRCVTDRFRSWIVRPAHSREAMAALVAVAAVLVTLVAVIVFFPRGGGGGEPTLSASVPGRPHRVLGALDPVPTYPGGWIALDGKGFTPGSVVSIGLAGRQIATVATDQDGAFRASIQLPARSATGTRRLSVVDEGSGVALEAPPRLQVLAGSAPALTVAPRPVHGHALLVVGAGFTPRLAVGLTLVQASGAIAKIGSIAASRTGDFALLAGLPRGLGKGRYELRGSDGQAVASTLVRVA